MIPFESDRLLLKEITLDDAEAIHQLHSFPEVDEFNTLGTPKNLHETIQYLMPLIQAQQANPRKSFFWKVLLKGNGNFIGIAGLTLSADKFKSGEIYYKILPGYAIIENDI